MALTIFACLYSVVTAWLLQSTVDEFLQKSSFCFIINNHVFTNHLEIDWSCYHIILELPIMLQFIHCASERGEVLVITVALTTSDSAHKIVSFFLRRITMLP